MQHRLFVFMALLGVSFLFSSAHPVDNFAFTEEKTEKTPVISETPEISRSAKIENLYKDFATINASMPSSISFKNAMLGYYELMEKGKIENEILTVVDFSLSSAKKRMWILDMTSKKVLFHTFVAHGQQSGMEMATKFSNVPNSHQSSLGFYLTAETYHGKHGLSLRMDGMEKGINSNARSRYIVVHGANYATSNFVEKVGRLGRSYGCPAVPTKLSKSIIKAIKGKSCFFIYYPSANYLQNSVFLNTQKV